MEGMWEVRVEGGITTPIRARLKHVGQITTENSLSISSEGHSRKYIHSYDVVDTKDASG